MEILNIPFVNKTGIRRTDNGRLQLPYSEDVYNHLQTIHASAQFCLAETASGDYLQLAFPDLADSVVPVLRDAQVKFKKPAVKTIEAFPSVEQAAVLKFREQFENKGRASICVHVQIKDMDGTLTLNGEYNWFVQSLAED